MSYDDKLDEVREYVPRHQQKRTIEMAASQDQLNGTLNTNYILSKLQANIDEFEKVTNKKYEKEEYFDSLGEEFWVRWYDLLERYDMEFLPPNLPLHRGTKSLLYQKLMSLIEEMMSRAGTRKDASRTREVTISWISD
ncbi:MAG: hypothetical protein ACOC53_05355 [Candidatus Saliniplasma sp.]